MKRLHESRFTALAAALVVGTTLSTSAAIAAEHGGGHGGSHGGGHGSGGHAEMKAGATAGHENPAGEPGNASEISRTVDIEITDNRYSTEKINIRKGETVRFVIRNGGQLVHEFNIGTPPMHAEHQKQMMMMAEHGALHADRIDHGRMKMDMGGGRTMEHNDPNSALLEPGKSAEVVWKFSRAGTFEFACNVPGHYDAGMVGNLTVE